MINNRKKWSKPQLIVLGRGTPEENVLDGCKMPTLVSVSGTTTAKNGCKARTSGTCGGVACSAQITS